MTNLKEISDAQNKPLQWIQYQVVNPKTICIQDTLNILSSVHSYVDSHMRVHMYTRACTHMYIITEEKQVMNLKGVDTGIWQRLKGGK